MENSQLAIDHARFYWNNISAVYLFHWHDNHIEFLGLNVCDLSFLRAFYYPRHRHKRTSQIRIDDPSKSVCYY